MYQYLFVTTVMRIANRCGCPSHSNVTGAQTSIALRITLHSNLGVCARLPTNPANIYSQFTADYIKSCCSVHEVMLTKRSDVMLPSNGLLQQAATRLAAEASRVTCQALEDLRSRRPIRCGCCYAILEQGGD